MSIAVTCTCGRSYTLKDDLAGRDLTCPSCGAVVRVPAPPAAAGSSGDPVFDRDKFLIRQKIAIDAKYAVTDEAGQPILFIVRPARLLRNLAALTAGVVVFFGAMFATIALTDALPRGPLADTLAVVLILAALLAAAAVAIALSAKRHTTIYRDQSRREPLLEVLQDKKFQPIVATYTVRTGQGETLALLRKNYLYNVFRKRWYCLTPGQEMLCVAKEDSIILSMLRRLLGPLFGLLRTNFIILRGTSDDVIGEFNRKVTILDRYVLDLSADRARTLDRRVALALGVMLDTGERR